MPISHICISCGDELARIRAVPDPHYGLAVVVCPGCNRACVRIRRNSLTSGWLGIRKLVGTLAALVAQALICGVLTAGTAGLIVQAGDQFRSFSAVFRSVTLLYSPEVSRLTSPTRLDPASLALFFGMLIVLGMLSGLWLRVFVAHVVWYRSFAVWIGWIVFWALSDFVILSIQKEISIGLGLSYTDTLPTRTELEVRMGILLVYLGGLFFGLFVGRLLDRSMANRRHYRFRRILRRRRRKQQLRRESR